MRFSWFKPCLIVGIVLGVMPRAEGQPIFRHADSLEWQFANHDVVVVGRLEEFDRVTKKGTIVVEASLRGKPRDRLAVRMETYPANAGQWQQLSSRLIIGLEAPSHVVKHVLDLSEGPHVMTSDFVVLRTPDEIIRSLKQSLPRLTGARPIAPFTLAVPPKAYAGSKVGRGGSHLRLTVPADDRLEKRAIEYLRSKDYLLRAEGARALVHFKSDENIARLMPLLDDPDGYAIQPAESNLGVEIRHYAVREAAYQTLAAWDVAVKAPAVRVERLNLELETLSLQRMTDDVARRLSEFKNLRELYYHAGFDDAGLKHVASLTKLERLGMGYSENRIATDAGIFELKALTNLTTLELRYPNLTDEGLKALAPLKNLRTLDLTYTKVTGSGLKDLSCLPNLTALHLHNTRIGDAEMKYLAPCRKLTHLYLGGTRVSDKGVREIAGCTDLVYINLEGTKASDRVFRDLAPFRKLHTIDFGDHKFTDASLRDLRTANLLHAIRQAYGVKDSRPRSALEVTSFRVPDRCTDACLKELASLENLETLYLAPKITDDGLKELSRFKKLTSLVMAGAKISDEGLKGLGQIKSLHTLHVTLNDARFVILHEAGLVHLLWGAVTAKGTRARSDDEIVKLDLFYQNIKDEGLEVLAKLPNLKQLSLNGGKVGDTGLRRLATLSKLRVLDLSNTQVTDVGLQCLHGLTNLRELDLSGAKVTKESVLAFRKALPKCLVEHR